MSNFKRPQHALIINGNNGEATLDRKMLFRIGIRSTQVADSVSGALRYLKKAGNGTEQQVDIIICGDSIQDGTSYGMIEKLRSLRPQMTIPVLIITLSPTRDLVMQTLSLGHSSFLSRPYTQENLIHQTIHAVRNTYGLPEKPVSVKVVEEPVEQETAQSLCEHGERQLKNRYWDNALEVFSNAISIDKNCPAAFAGRAKAWRGKNELANYKDDLTTAGSLYLQQHDYKNACNTLKPLYKDEKQQNPIFFTAQHLLKKGDIQHAATAFVYGEELSPSILLHQQISRACAFTNAPQKAIASLCKELFVQGHKEKAKRLYKRIVGPAVQPPVESLEKAHWLERFPRVFEVVSVAKYAYKTYRVVSQGRQAA